MPFLTCIFSFFTLMCCGGHLEAMLTQASVLVLPDGKRVALVSDRHGAKPESAEQLKSLTQTLATHSQQTPNNLLVLVEGVSQLYYQKTKNKNVLSHLCKEIAKQGLENINAETSGMPEQALQAVYFLAAQNQSIVATLLSLKNALKELTFKTLLSVFKTEKGNLETQLETIDHAQLQTNMKKHLALAVGYKIQLKQTLTQYAIVPTDYIADIYQKTEQPTRNTLINFIIGAFSPLLELKYICKILAARQKEVALFAGYKHTNTIHSLLLTSNATHKDSLGSVGPQALGLTAQELARILSPGRDYKKLFTTCCAITTGLTLSTAAIAGLLYQLIIERYSPSC